MQIKCTKHQTLCFLTKARRENRQKRKVNSLISRLSICTSFAGELQRKNPTSPKRILHYLAKRAIGVTPVSSTLILRWFGLVFISCSANGLFALVKGNKTILAGAPLSGFMPGGLAPRQTKLAGALLSGYKTPVTKPDKGAPASIVWSRGLTPWRFERKTRKRFTRRKFFLRLS